MRSPLTVIAVLAIGSLVGVAAGCGGGSGGGQSTTAPATEAATTAGTTTEETTTAPAEETTTAPADDTTTSPAGDVSAGESVFSSSCSACHLDNGISGGGIGPQLSGKGLSADRIHDQVVNGGGAMPGGLVSGTELDDVVAYVVSVQ